MCVKQGDWPVVFRGFLGMRIIIAVLRWVGKYPRERERLKIVSRMFVMLSGSCFSWAIVMPVGPGDLFLKDCRVLLNSLLVILGNRGFRRERSAAGRGFVAS